MIGRLILLQTDELHLRRKRLADAPVKGNKPRKIQFDFDTAFVFFATLIDSDTIDTDGSDTINAS